MQKEIRDPGCSVAPNWWDRCFSWDSRPCHCCWIIWRFVSGIQNPLQRAKRSVPIFLVSRRLEKVEQDVGDSRCAVRISEIGFPAQSTVSRGDRPIRSTRDSGHPAKQVLASGPGIANLILFAGDVPEFEMKARSTCAAMIKIRRRERQRRREVSNG